MFKKGFTMRAVVTNKIKIVIPYKSLKKYGIKKGSVLHFYEKGGEIRIVLNACEMIKTNAGFLGTKGKLLKALMKEKTQERKF
jgi:bifunctional DNA-binding transcriptional regulator/antitoxin component of YhaV-PrlF toxin-antitoxin module